ncbi:MAG: DUF1203 domain-containing protein [Archangium sp.]
MSFVIRGLDPAQFSTLTAQHRVQRRIVDESPGYPCRVTLEDARVGEEVLLLNFEHLETDSPYRAAGPIFIRPGAPQRVCAPGEVPPALARRLLSVRGYDAKGMMVASDVVEGRELAARLDTFLADPKIAFAHLHNAKPGCFAARVDRV